MAWVHKSLGNGWTKATETITTVQDQATVHHSSVVDFLPPDQDFLVIATANDLSDSGAIDLYVSATSGGTYTALKTGIITPVDNNTSAAWYDVSTNGLGAYNKISFMPDGAQDASDTITITLMYKAYDQDAFKG